MSDSFKDALQKAGVAAPEPAKDPVEKKKWAKELDDDETRLNPFDAPALTKPKETPRTPTTPKKK